jgi:hypothetical protein
MEKRDLELPSLTTINRMNNDNSMNIMNNINTRTLKPDTLEGNLLQYIPDNIVKMFSMFHLLCKEHRKHINHRHFLEHADIEEDMIMKLLEKRRKKDETWREQLGNYFKDKIERTKIELITIGKEKRER